MLSKLITYYQSLKERSTSNVASCIKHDLSIILDLTDNIDKVESQKLHDIYQEILAQLEKFNFEMSEVSNNLYNKITSEEIKYFTKSYEIYDAMSDDTDEYILYRTSHRVINNSDEFHQRIKLYSSWKHPGLFVRPGINNFVDSMVDSDPLYIADHTTGLLEPVKKLWNAEFQSRIRYLLIDDSSDIIFKKLPTNQFGFIVYSGFFDFKPFEIIKKYLLESMKLLKPGGVIIFTYNNCDVPSAVQNVENHFNCYTPGRLLKDFISGLGFELLHSTSSSSGLNWLEIKKPGKLSSIKGGQTLGKIIRHDADVI